MSLPMSQPPSCFGNIPFLISFKLQTVVSDIYSKGIGEKENRIY